MQASRETVQGVRDSVRRRQQELEVWPLAAARRYSSSSRPNGWDIVLCKGLMGGTQGLPCIPTPRWTSCDGRMIEVWELGDDIDSGGIYWTEILSAKTQRAAQAFVAARISSCNQDKVVQDHLSQSKHEGLAAEGFCSTRCCHFNTLYQCVFSCLIL